MQPVVVLGDTAVAQSSVAAGQPGDGPFDHGPMLTVFGQPIRVMSGPPGGAQPRVVGTDPKGFAAAAAGASGAQRASGAGRAESGPSAAADRSGQPVGAGRGAVVMVDAEIIDGEPTRDDPGHR